MLDFRRKPLAAPASIDQEFVQIFTQTASFPTRQSMQRRWDVNRGKCCHLVVEATAGSAVAVVTFRADRI
jgi:hypothetical protein